jgi:hypothetical protein
MDPHSQTGKVLGYPRHVSNIARMSTIPPLERFFSGRSLASSFEILIVANAVLANHYQKFSTDLYINRRSKIVPRIDCV